MNSEKTTDVGIIGAGGISALSHLPEIAEIEGMRVTHLCGRTKRRLEMLCERFLVPWYSLGWEDWLSDESLDERIEGGI